jgi:hypothetical protein
MGGGASFLGGFVEGANRRRGELHAEDHQREEEDRQGLLHILDAASKSDQLDPSAMPQLVSMMMEAHGADKKELAGVKTAFKALLGQGYETTGTKITGYDTRPVTDNTGAEAPYVSDPGDAPVADFNARIRKPLFQSPEEMSRRQTDAEVARQRALLPVLREKTAIDTEHDLAVEAARGRARAEQAAARAEAQKKLLIQRYGLMATKDLDARAQTKLTEMRAFDPNVTEGEAREAAAKEINGEYGLKSEKLKSQIGFTNRATQAIGENLGLRKEMVDIAREGNDIRWNELDLKSQTLALEEAYKNAMVEMKGNTARQQKYAAEATPIMQQIRQVEAQRASLERMMVAGFATDPGVANQVKAYADQLTSLRKQLNDATSKFTSAQAEPKLDVKTPAPTRGRGNGAVIQSSGTEDPQVRAYADKFFRGDYAAAVRRIQADERAKRRR